MQLKKDLTLLYELRKKDLTQAKRKATQIPSESNKSEQAFLEGYVSAIRGVLDYLDKHDQMGLI